MEGLAAYKIRLKKNLSASRALPTKMNKYADDFNGLAEK